MKYRPHSRYESPDALRITPDGNIILKDGGNVTEYLKGWAEYNSITAPEPVNFFLRKQAEILLLPHVS